MASTVKKWGNSAAVRIPASVLAAAGLELDQPIDVREENGRIVIEAAPARKFRIADLVRGIHADNLHDAVDAGPPRGREAW